MAKRRHITGALGLALGAFTLAGAPAQAATRPDPALGNGLGRLVAAATQPAGAKAFAAPHLGLKIDQDALAIRDAQGRVLVDVTPRTGVDAASYGQQVAALGFVVKSADVAHGTLEGFVPLDKVLALSGLADTGTVAQALKPKTNVGSATSQGVALERADKVQATGIDGKGITVGALSDSYDTASLDLNGNPLTDHAADDVKSGDLPGPGNPVNSQPVVVVSDLDAADTNTDEGRAMLQIVHDVAPKAKLCFATADAGLLGFADNVRALANPSGKCGANVIVDDVIYFDEPFFSDNPLSDAIDDVAAAGVNYFSSAQNEGEQEAWSSPVKLIPAAQGLKGTNLDFSEVDPALYDGGLQDMDPGPGTDVAQTLTLGDAGGIFDLQWDDPVDVNGATLSAPVFTAKGTLTAPDSAPSFVFKAGADQVGKTVQFRTDAVPSGSVDLILTVDDPEGNTIATVDTGSSPEVLATTLKEAGNYTITITGFDGDEGPFTIDVRDVLAPSKVTTDFNVLLFDADGNYVGSIADLNTLSGRPSELAQLGGFPELQFVISRAGTGPIGATRLRNVLFDDMFFTEYSDPLAPATFGHSTAAGATSVAAYDPFRPFLPEFFTSPGGDLPIVFDSAGNRYPTVQVRRKPEIAAADGGNNSFFGNDNARDADTQPNFFGTSAAAPHAAGIAALVLQHLGGPNSITPAALRKRMENSAYVHDLDPDHAAGTVAGVTLSADGPQGYENDVIPGPMNDPNFFTLTNGGPVGLRSVTLYGESASPTALGTSRPIIGDGIVFDTRAFDGVTPFRLDGFPFTVGTATGIAPSAVKASYSAPTGNPGQYRHLTLSFSPRLPAGATVRFGIDRDLAISGYGGADEGNGADELGGATFLPQRVSVPFGLAFGVKRTDGNSYGGLMLNKLGSGWSPLDGYGVVDAERAVLNR